jgi:hypothetical protein
VSWCDECLCRCGNVGRNRDNMGWAQRTLVGGRCSSEHNDHTVYVFIDRDRYHKLQKSGQRVHL